MIPPVLKAEAKLTTGGTVSVATREVAALEVQDSDGLGIVAVLLVGGEREVDGRWVLVDAAPWQGRKGESMSAARSTLLATARRQPWLDWLRLHVDTLWPAFLLAYTEAAESGHTALVAELESEHARGTIRDRLPRHEILVSEHRAAVSSLVERFGEADAGRLAQDLLAYLVALVGYRKVTLNPVGVPDFVLEDPATAPGKVAVTLDAADAERLVALCRQAGDEELASLLEAAAARDETPRGGA